MSTPEDSVAWNFERGDPRELNDATVNVARSLWSVHGMSCAIHRLVRETLEKLRIVMANERGPKDYEENEHLRRYNELLNLLAKRATQSSFNNGDGDEGGSKRLLGWILTLMCVLTAGGIAGGVVMYGEAAALRATVTQWQLSSDRRMDQIERRLDRMERP